MMSDYVSAGSQHFVTQCVLSAVYLLWIQHSIHFAFFFFFFVAAQSRGSVGAEALILATAQNLKQCGVSAYKWQRWQAFHKHTHTHTHKHRLLTISNLASILNNKRGLIPTPVIITHSQESHCLIHQKACGNCAYAVQRLVHRTGLSSSLILAEPATPPVPSFCKAAWSSTLIQDCQHWAWALSDTVSEARPPTETTVGMVRTVLRDKCTTGGVWGEDQTWHADHLRS